MVQSLCMKIGIDLCKIKPAKRLHCVLCGLFGFLFIVTQAGCGRTASSGPADGWTFSDTSYAEEQSFYFDTICQIRIYAIDEERYLAWKTETMPAEESESSDSSASSTFSLPDFDTAAKDLIHDAFLKCAEYESLLSKTIDTSDIGRINAAGGEAVTCSNETIELLEKALGYCELSGGAFDITIGSVQALWDFHGENPQVPDADAVREALAPVDYHGVQLNPEEGTVRLSNPDTRLDAGGIAKGWIADRLCEYLKERGVTSALISLGGNVACVGAKPSGASFRIGVEKPFSDRTELLGLVDLTDGTLVTSGTYERYFKSGGVLYHHILDPSTGYPAGTDVTSVTVLGRSGTSADCDALATICLLLGSEDGKTLIEGLDGFEAQFVRTDGTITKTAGFLMTDA